MVAGDVINTAARLQSAAPVNGVLVGESTYRATRHVIEYAEAERSRPRGRPSRFAVWQAVAPRSRFGSDVEQARWLRSSAASEKSRLLADALTRVPQRRAPELVTLVGVPGIGKSRLVHELFSIVDEARHHRLAAGRSSPTARAQLLGAGRDGEVAGRHSRDRRSRGGGAEAHRGDHGLLHVRVGGRLGHDPLEAARRARLRARRRRRQPRRDIRRLAALLRGARRAAPDRPRVRGPALGRRRPPRLRRRSRRPCRRGCRCSSSAARGRSCSCGGRAGAAARRTP